LHPASEIAETTAKTWTSQAEGERPAHTFDIVSSVIDVLILRDPQARAEPRSSGKIHRHGTLYHST
jgi:hypothetical protein